MTAGTWLALTGGFFEKFGENSACWKVSTLSEMHVSSRSLPLGVLYSACYMHTGLAVLENDDILALSSREFTNESVDQAGLVEEKAGSSLQKLADPVCT